MLNYFDAHTVLSPFFQNRFLLLFLLLVLACGKWLWVAWPSSLCGRGRERFHTKFFLVLCKKKWRRKGGNEKSRYNLDFLSYSGFFFTGKKRKNAGWNGRDFSPPSAAAALRLGENGVCAILWVGWGGRGKSGKCISCPSLPPPTTNPRGREKNTVCTAKKEKKQCLPLSFPTSLQQTNSDEPTGDTQNSISQNIKIYCCRKVLSLKSLAHYIL